MTAPKAGRRAAAWPGPHAEIFRAALRAQARRTPKHRKEADQ